MAMKTISIGSCERRRYQPPRVNWQRERSGKAKRHASPISGGPGVQGSHRLSVRNTCVPYPPPPQCEQLPTNVRETARRRPACGERWPISRLPIGNRTTKGSSEILPYDASVIVTTNLPFEEWKEVLGSERLREARRRRRGRRPTRRSRPSTPGPAGSSLRRPGTPFSARRSHARRSRGPLYAPRGSGYGLCQESRSVPVPVRPSPLEVPCNDSASWLHPD